MPITPPPCAPVRSAAVVNAEIRELASRIGLSDTERRRMIRLWAEWQDADARERAARDAELAA
jgi:hypothetical protein